MAKTTEELILDIRREAYEPDKLSPGRASELLVELSSLIGTLKETELGKEMLYNQEVLLHQTTEGSKAKGETIAKAGDRYRDWKLAKYIKETAEGMIGTLKYFVSEKNREFRDAKY